MADGNVILYFKVGPLTHTHLNTDVIKDNINIVPLLPNI